MAKLDYPEVDYGLTCVVLSRVVNPNALKQRIEHLQIDCAEQQDAIQNGG